MCSILRFLLLLPSLAELFGSVSGQKYPLRHRKPFKITPEVKRSLPDQWIEQRLDHFNKSDDRTWKMRYLANEEHFAPGGAIVIFIGAEWRISAGNILGGLAYDIAQQNRAYLFYTEHRYYGKSLPTPDASTKNLQYLRVDQALADLAHFVEHVKKTIPGVEESKVLAIGGSCAGSYATWFRAKYPHLVDVAWASSAPVLATADLYLLGRSYMSLGGRKCYEIIEKGMQQLRKKITSRGGPKDVAKLFNLCNPLKFTDPLDLGSFHFAIADEFAETLQFRAGSVQSYCMKLQNDAKRGELHAVAEFVRNQWNQRTKCSKVDYKSLVEANKDPKWEAIKTSSSLRQWFYHYCTDWGYFQTDTSKKQPFGDGSNNLDLYVYLCKDLFEEDFTKNAREILEKGIEETNSQYGGLTPNVTRVIFTHGALDPWHSVGVEKDLNNESPVITIPDSSHCEDLKSLSLYDADEMKAAKLRVQQLIAEWLGVQAPQCNDTSAQVSSARTRKWFRYTSRQGRNSQQIYDEDQYL